jgi:hypothetical protein
MPFTIFSKNYTISASEINNNFYHVAQGNFIPRTGSSLTSIDVTNDLGSNFFRWNNLYVNNLNISNTITGNNTLWTLIKDVYVTSTATTLNITGLNGDADEEYLIYAYLSIVSTTSIYLETNITTSSYSIILTAEGVAYTGTGNYDIRVATFNTINSSGFVKINFFSKTGFYRTVYSEAMIGIQNTTINNISICRGNLNNTTVTLTSITFNTDGSNLKGSRALVFARR